VHHSGADFGEVALLPGTMKSAKGVARLSNERARSSLVALDAALRARLVTDIVTSIYTGWPQRGRTTPSPAGSQSRPSSVSP
jgi:hypothetical protein